MTSMDFLKQIEGARKVECQGLAPKSVDPQGTLQAIHFLLDGSAIGEHKATSDSQQFQPLSKNRIETGMLVRQIREAAMNAMASNILTRMVCGSPATRFLDATEDLVPGIKLDQWRAARPSRPKQSTPR